MNIKTIIHDNGERTTRALKQFVIHNGQWIELPKLLTLQAQ